MATHSSVLAWRIPGTAEPGGLPSMGCTESDTTEVTAAATAAGRVESDTGPLSRTLAFLSDGDDTENRD